MHQFDHLDLDIPAFLIIPQEVRRKAWEGFQHTTMHRDAPARSFELPKQVEPETREAHKLMKQARKAPAKPRKRKSRKA